MFTFISENLGTIVIGIVVLVIVAAIIVLIVRDKRKGKCTGCDCGSCPGNRSCRTPESN